MKGGWKFWVGDMLAGTTVGAGVGLAHHLLVPQSLGMVAGVFLGMIAGRNRRKICQTSVENLGCFY
jgi:F0F1-type ATP synthase assembly protein I